MRKLTPQQFDDLVAAAKLIEGTAEKPRVFITIDQKIIKCFRPRHRRFTSAMFRPYAKRFINNAKSLKALGIPGPNILEAYHVPERRWYVVIYDCIEGQSLRDLVAAGDSEIINAFIAFVAKLHQQGVFFRALHLGNVLKQPDNSFALIDITDMRVKRRALTSSQRIRNIRHILKNRDDALIWAKFGKEKFIEAYYLATGLKNFML